tara:strand:- start:640 stop:1113 length:474 start_codon:yes stop_codon:yes gene_type:complete
MYKNHGSDFKYVGIDIFDEGDDVKNEVAPSFKFNNPLKTIYFKYLKRQNPYSVEGVKDLLKKYNKNTTIIKGNTNSILKDLNLKDVDYIFVDGGHDYATVKNDLIFSKKFLAPNGTILCDDYNLSYAPGVKKAIDEFISENDCKHEIILERFAKIEF